MMLLIAAALTTIASQTATSAAADQPMVIAGGALDPAFTKAEVYRDTPVAAKAPNTSACRVASTYVAKVNAGEYARMADLFEEDAVLLEPSGVSIRGHAGIKAFYEGRIGQMRPRVIAVAYMGTGNDCAVELAVRRDMAGQQRFGLASIDHFTIGRSGKIARMVAFPRPPRQ